MAQSHTSSESQAKHQREAEQSLKQAHRDAAKRQAQTGARFGAVTPPDVAGGVDKSKDQLGGRITAPDVTAGARHPLGPHVNNPLTGDFRPVPKENP